MSGASRPLFCYGTLQLESVQLATFGRRLEGRPETLPAYSLVPLVIEDPAVIAISGRAEHTMARWTGQREDTIDGTVLQLTDQELRQADDYEVPAVRRTWVELVSGRGAWAYVEARDRSQPPVDGQDPHPLD